MIRVLIFLFILVLSSSLLFADADTIKTYSAAQIEIIANKNIAPFDALYYGTDFRTNLFDKNGSAIIRRGSLFTQDLYSEGFKRSDIKVIIDGEQYHNACPNRMDASAGRVNPLEMSSVEITKSASQPGTSIYGKVEYHRKPLDDDLNISGFINGIASSQNLIDASVNVAALKHSLIFRYSSGIPFMSGDGKSYKDLYGYRDNYSFSNFNGGFRGETDDFKYGFSVSQLEKISFPYLQMDEIFTRLYSFNTSYKSHKIYINYTEHLMDNTLRNNPMLMVSDAKSLTVGAKGDFYELIYHNWKTDNFFTNSQTGLVLNNAMLPNIHHFYAGLNDKFDFSEFLLSLRIGAVYYKTGNDDNSEFYSRLYPNSDNNRIFLSGGANLTYSLPLGESVMFAAGTDIAIEAPEAEQLFIAVKKPMNNPDWSGNPNLNQPIKLNFRTVLNHENINIEGFYNHVFNYVNISSASTTMKKVQTFENITAQIFGINLSVFLFNIIESNLSYIYGQNLSNQKPLSEIMPLSISNSIYLPEIFGIQTELSHHYEASQTRFDSDLKEFESDPWNKLSVKAAYKYHDFRLTFEIDNILGSNYFRHLSYSRNPFSSGMRVYEPGTTVNLTLVFDMNLNNERKK